MQHSSHHYMYIVLSQKVNMRLCDGYCIKGFLLHSDLTVYPLIFAEQADIAREFGKIYAAPKLTRNWLQSGLLFWY
ncbi:hypothetical protein PC128_g5527 [Phytophthora cactorum]|nr:hypothetical protein PC121_g3967 [Phytophthora cactorum]KAG3199143.1 hypothetical protein PC128_g5527 [Phytophthora cactorum]KAG4062774.1 hypothetical protein PC123_g2349 [Phytophthora cactorum]